MTVSTSLGTTGTTVAGHDITGYMRGFGAALLWLALVLAPAIGLAQARSAPEVFGVRFGINGDITRVVLDLDGPARFATRALASPPRLVVELDSVRWRVRDHPQGRTTGLARGVTYGHLENGRARLVVDVDRPFRIVRQERLPPSGETRHHRILVDLVALPAPAAPPQVAAAPPAQQPATTPPPATAQPPATTPPPATAQAPATAQQPATAPPARDAARQAPPAAERAATGAVARAPAATPPGAGPPRARPGTAAPVVAAPAEAPAVAGAPARLPLPGVTEPGVVAPDPPIPPDSTVSDVADGDPASGAMDAAGRTVDVALGPVLRAPPPPQRRRIIALDPGHGGADPGTIGINGMLEKEVTLDLAKRLRALIEATGRYDVVMTRNDDVFVSLRDRMERARQSNAALFISIHADSLGDARMRGASVYTLSDQASDAEAARLATKENRADVIAGTDLSAHDEIVAGILIDLAQRVTNNKSIEFADVLTAELGDVTALVRNTRRFAGFVVLKSPDLPSVLLELGYLSNPTDAANLARPEYRDRLARATLRAIDRYFAQVDATL